MTPNRDSLLRPKASVAVETDMREFEELGDITAHWYPRHPSYRLSGQRNPQPGDVALCGHVKNTRSHYSEFTTLTCSACARRRGDA